MNKKMLLLIAISFYTSLAKPSKTINEIKDFVDRFVPNTKQLMEKIEKKLVTLDSKIKLLQKKEPTVDKKIELGLSIIDDINTIVPDFKKLNIKTTKAIKNYNKMLEAAFNISGGITAAGGLFIPTAIGTSATIFSIYHKTLNPNFKKIIKNMTQTMEHIDTSLQIIIKDSKLILSEAKKLIEN